MAIEVEIPIYADEPPHFLLWAVDEIMPILLGLGVGILMGHIFIATVIGFVVSHFYKKFRDQHAGGYLYHLLYWYGFGFTRSPSFINPYIRILFP